MALNIFEGSRRISLLVAGLATLGTIAALVFNDPYVSMDYYIAQPDGPFERRIEPCPSTAGKHYFTTETQTGNRISIDLCLLAMSFGEKGEQLIPYKLDEKGRIWGAASFSSEVSDYERQLEDRFALSADDSDFADEKFTQRRLKEIKEGILYLGIGLATFGFFVWGIGWIVRGFFGIPRGMDRKPKEPKLKASDDGSASGGSAV